MDTSDEQKSAPSNDMRRDANSADQERKDTSPSDPVRFTDWASI